MIILRLISNLDYTSKVTEDFIIYHLTVQDMNNIEESFRHSMESCKMEDDNAYDAGVHGKQAAEKYMRISELPSVLLVQLKRFDYSYKSGR